MVDFSISTSWNARQSQTIPSMIDEIERIGFKKIELGFMHTRKDIREISSIKKKTGLEVTSTHNFCPLPEGVSQREASPDYYSLASLDEEEQRRALECTKATIKTASELGASHVVMHAGRIEIRDRIKELECAMGKRDEYKKIKDEMSEERSKKAARYFERAASSIENLLSLAVKENIILGIETRYYHNEIPSMDEMRALMDRFKDRHIGYWHDAGHAQLYENLGFLKHKDVLENLGERIVGMHLHDIEGIDDHRAPLRGSFDFSILLPYIKKDTLLVLEPHYPATAEEVKRGTEYLSGLFGEKQ